MSRESVQNIGGFLVNPTPTGANSFTGWSSGMAANMSMTAGANGIPVVGADNGAAGVVLQQMAVYNQQQAVIARAGSSPFDIYNTAQPIGAFLGDFFANLYANGNQPLQMAGSLFGMLGTSVASFFRTNPTFADAADVAYSSSCDDADLAAAKIAADPFCNPIYGMSSADFEDVPTTLANMQNPANFTVNSALNDGTTAGFDPTDKDSCEKGWDDTYLLCGSVGIAKSKTEKTVGNFISDCVSRNSSDAEFSPMGSSDSNGIGTGSACVLGTEDQINNYPNEKDLYNYVQYAVINSNMGQGSMLGSQADGSASN